MHTPRLLIIKFYNNSLNNYFLYVVTFMTSQGWGEQFIIGQANFLLQVRKF